MRLSISLPFPRAPLAALVLALAAVAPAASAQNRDRNRDRDRDRDRGDRATYRIDTTVTVGRDATVDLGLISGDVIVTASNRDEVRVRASSEEIPLRFEHIGNSVRVSTVSGQYRRSGDQRMEVVVPIGSRVRASSVSGDVDVRGVRGELEATAVSGDVTVEDVTRRATLRTVSGDLTARRIDGDVRARSVSGDIHIERADGELDAESTSGEVELVDARSSNVHAESISGRLTYDGTITRDGRYDFSSHSGTVRLVVPTDAALSLSVSSFSGTVNSELPATLAPTSRDGSGRGPSRRRMDLTINGGGARVTAQTFSGNIVIERAGSSRKNRE